MVCVSPGILETKVMVAPNSPSARAKASMVPAMMPGSASGSVMVAKLQNGLAPSVAAASSSRRSIASIDSRMARTISGNAMTPQEIAAPVQRNENTMPKWSARKAPTGALRPERDEQQIAGHHRRQHQRQVDKRIEQRLAPEILARQQQRDGDAERQRHQPSPRCAMRSDSAIAVQSWAVRSSTLATTPA